MPALGNRPRKKYSGPTERFARIIEKHEKSIARHTAIQSWIGAVQLIVGASTTAALLYVTQQQYRASERQVLLEYAKVAPQFAANITSFPTDLSAAVPTSFPRDLSVRISRGEASITDVTPIQEVEVSRLRKGGHAVCAVRISNYFDSKSGNITDFSAKLLFGNIARDPAKFQDAGMADFLIVRPQNSLVTITFDDIFGEKRIKRYVGDNGTLSELPAGDFSKSTVYETVDASIDKRSFAVPGSFSLIGAEPKTVGCRSLFGLKGGRASFYN